jgi:hypothetical protein
MTATEVYTEPLVPAGSTLSGFSGKTVQGPPFPDPYASVPDPTSSNVYGVGQNTIINPGEYLGPVTVGPGTTALTPGIYIFEQGLTVAGTATLTGKGVMLFIGVPNAVPGVPQPNAAFTVQGNGEVNITPQLSGTYQGISVFQSRSDANPMVIAGNGSGNIYGGLIYAPAANVGISGNGAVAAGEVVAGAVGGNGTCGGNSQFSVGFAVLLSTPQSATIPSGGNNSDNVEVVGSPGRGAPQGTITFYVCNPTIAPGSCTSLNGTSVGSASLNPGADVTSTATSPTSQFPLSGAMPGTWCYAAYYGGDPNYGTSNDTTPDGCFTVDGPTASFTFPVQVTPIPTYHLTGNSSWKGLDSCSPSPSQNMCGTVADVGGGSITGVAYFIAQTGGGCWNGSTWSGACNFTPVSNFTSGGTTWAQTWAQSNFVAGNTYTLSIQVTDSAKLVTVASTSFKIAS